MLLKNQNIKYVTIGEFKKISDTIGEYTKNIQFNCEKYKSISSKINKIETILNIEDEFSLNLLSIIEQDNELNGIFCDINNINNGIKNCEIDFEKKLQNLFVEEIITNKKYKIKCKNSELKIWDTHFNGDLYFNGSLYYEDYELYKIKSKYYVDSNTYVKCRGLEIYLLYDNFIKSQCKVPERQKIGNVKIEVINSDTL